MSPSVAESAAGRGRGALPIYPRFADRAALEAHQLDALNALLARLMDNPFYAPRLRAAGLDAGATALADLRRLPTTDKADLVDDQRRHPPFGSNRSVPTSAFVRLHQTSGTSGRPLRWLDTAEDWTWMLRSWGEIFRAAGLTPGDRVFFPFSFGPFLAFWAAFDAASAYGCLAVPGGAMRSDARLAMMRAIGATAVCCTPTYALHLAEQMAASADVQDHHHAVRTLIVAGEPGGCVPAVRQRIAEGWSGPDAAADDAVRVIDHHGMTEVGPVSVADPARPDRLRLLEAAYLCEVIDPDDGAPIDAPGAIGELVLTPLGRVGMPLVRYRTGDLVRFAAPLPDDGPERHLDGGILSRVDDMLVVRGVNVYPAAVDRVVRATAGRAEYRVRVRRDGAMTEIAIDVEASPQATAVEADALAGQVEAALRRAFNLRMPTRALPHASLPRFEVKARRWRLA
ncbi:MAG: AMP-binding protein [Acidobacteriota bacterium]